MKTNLIQVLDITGTPALCFDIDSVKTLEKQYPGQLLRITQDGLSQLTGGDGAGYDEYRFVVAKTAQEKNLLLKVQPIRCYLRDHEMNAKVLNLNPYQSVRYLRALVEAERRFPVTLIVNEQVLGDDSDSLLSHISQNCIIHVLDNQHPQKLLSILYVKQPGPQSQIHKLQQVQTSTTIEQLTLQISSITSIPKQNLILVYGGRILGKEKKILDYRILSNGILYAVDQRKFMKKVSKEEFHSRVQEIRKSKESYKALMSKINSSGGLGTQSGSGKKIQGGSRIQGQSSQVNFNVKQGSSSRVANVNVNARSSNKKEERSEEWRSDQQDPYKSQERDTIKYQQRVSQQRPQQIYATHQGLQPQDIPTSPIKIFNRLDSYNSVNSELKQGRVVTKETDIYHDPHGYIHQHSQQKTLFKNGRTKIVDVDVAEDEKGNVVKIEKDIVNIKRDSKTGNVIKIETDIIEDANNRTIVKKEEVRDQDGNLIKQDTEIIKNQSGKKQIKKYQKGFIRDSQNNLTQITTQILEDNRGQPYKIETDITQTLLQDGHGHITQHSKDIKQQNGITSVIERNIVRDHEGNIMEQKTDTIQITEDEAGNIYKHEINEMDSINRKIVIERDIITNPRGDIISKETNMKVTQQDANSRIVRHETDVIEEADGRAYVVERNVVEDGQGHVLEEDSETYEMERGEIKEPKEIEIAKEEPQAVEIEGQRQPLINAGTEVSIDQLGNTHTHQKQLIQKEGKTTFVDRDTIEDPRGKIIRVETDIVQIQGQDNGNMHKHKSEIIEQQGKITMVETDEIVDIDGVMIRKQRDTIQIEGGDDGSVFKHEKDIIQEEGRTKIIERDIVEDSDGNVIKSQTKVTEVEDKEDTVEVHENQEIIQAVDENELQGNNQIERDVEVIQDEQGNIMRRQQQVTEQQNGTRTFVDRCTIENSQGQVVRQQTQVINVDSEQGVRRHVVDYTQQDNKVVIQESVSKENLEGQVVEKNRETIEIQQLEDGNVKKREMEVCQYDGKKTIHVRNTVQDETGKILSKDSDLVELQANQGQGLPICQQAQYNEGQVSSLQKVNVERSYNIDQQGNTHILQTQTRNSQGHQTQIQRQFISNQQGQLIKTQTGILDVQERQDGSTKLTAIDIVQEGNRVTVVQNDSIQDSEGREIRTESGTLRIKELEGGVKKKVKENIIQEGGIRLRVQKETYEDAEGNVIQEKVKTTELVDKIDEGNMITAQAFKRKQQSVRQDSDGNFHFHQRQIIDNEDGKRTLVQTQVIRSQQNQLLKATTDVIEMTDLESGNVHRREVNIIEKPGKVTVAESNAVQNADGERLEGEVESVVVTEGPDGEIVRKETGIVVEDCQKTIVERVIVEDGEGNVLKSETTKKRIYLDQSGEQQGRDLQVYKVDQIQIEGEPSTIEKQITVDISGIVQTKQRLTTFKQQQGKQIVEMVDVKVIEDQDGSIVDQTMNVTKVIRHEDGQVQVTQNNVPIAGGLEGYEQIQSEIRDSLELPQPVSSEIQDIERELVQDEQGNLHTFQKQIINKGDGNRTVIKSQTVQNPQGHLLTINTNITDTQQLQNGIILVHTTSITSGDKVITREIISVEDQDGSIISEKSKKVEVGEEEGLIRTKRVDVLRQDGIVRINNQQTLEDQDGNIIDQKTNQLEIQDTNQAVRQQAQKVARAQLLGQVTGIVKQMRQDQQGNMHLIQTQTIEDHGKRLTIDTETVENRDGIFLNAQTNILEQQLLENGQIQKTKTVITEKGGMVQVIEYSEIRDEGEGEGEGMRGLLGQKVGIVGGEDDENDGLYGQLDRGMQGGSGVRGGEGQGIEMTEFKHQQGSIGSSVTQSKKKVQVNLLDSSLETSAKNISSLPLQSKKLLNPSQSPSKPQYPQQYPITLISKSGSRIPIEVRYDQIIDQVIQKLSQRIGKSKSEIRLYADGKELAEYEIIWELGIGPQREVYWDCNGELL